MEKHIYDSELKLMELIWSKEPVNAKELSLLAVDKLGWNKNTTYTVLKKLVGKAYVQRSEPGFVCTALIKREAVQKAETRSLINKLYSGSRKAFLAAFLEDEPLSREEIDQLRKLIDSQ